MIKAFPDSERKQLFFTLLKVMGGSQVNVAFDGSGDSGSIDVVELLNRNGERIDLEGAKFEWPTKSSEFDPLKKEWVRTHTLEEMDVKEILTQICEDALEEVGVDWYNHEGGYGELTIDLTTQPTKVELGVNVREMTTHYTGYDLTDEEEEDAPTSSQSD